MKAKGKARLASTTTGRDGPSNRNRAADWHYGKKDKTSDFALASTSEQGGRFPQEESLFVRTQPMSAGS